jgi:hypothetical protein
MRNKGQQRHKRATTTKNGRVSFGRPSLFFLEDSHTAATRDRDNATGKETATVAGRQKTVYYRAGLFSLFFLYWIFLFRLLLTATTVVSAEECALTGARAVL